MGEDKTTKERVSELEQKFNTMMDGITDLKESVAEMSVKQDKMYPIVRDIIYVKGYGSFTWKMLKGLGVIGLGCITSWHLFKDHIKHFFHYIFN